VISFGTDGWRSTMDTDFTIQNVAIASQGIANYLVKQKFNKKGIIIGYDTRENSQIYAEEVARVLLGNGIRIFFTKQDTPIPVITYEILNRKLDGGIMITASHNPPEYNGIKFIPYYASPALPDITDSIMNEIRAVWENPVVKKESIQEKEKKKQLERVDIKQAYNNHVLKIIKGEIIKKANLKVAFDALYGTSRAYLPELLKVLGVEVEVHHDYIDTSFGGGSPNPTKENLKLIGESIIAKNLDLGLACDGDADRIGVLDNEGTFLHANILFALLFDYELEQGKEGDVVRTVGTTHLIDRIAEAHNCKVYETPVGAKFVGQYMREKRLLMGGEESGGMMFREHIAEKDGIFANLKVLEMVAYYQQPLAAITAHLFEKYGKIFFTLINFPCEDENKGKALKNIVKILPETVSKLKIISTTNIDGFKFVLEDNSWLLIRPSGTEPLLRLYGEANSEGELNAILDEGKQLLERAQN